MKTNDWNSLQDLRRPLMGGLARPERGRARRRGLTLTEILVASFVLAFGLTAVLTVLPFGAFQLNRMNVADMSGACGRGALQQIRMADWQKPDVLNVNWAANTVPADPYIVDPLGHIAANRPTQKCFPSSATSERLFAFTLANIAALPNGDDLAEANLHFRWNDDTIFAPNDTSSRPTLVTRSDDPAKPSTSGEFTWIYMVTPIVDVQADVERNALSDIGVTYADNILQYEVATIVFHRRDLYPDPADPYQPVRRLELKKFHNGLPTALRNTLDRKDEINTTGAYITLESSIPEDLDLTSIKWILLTGRSQELHNTPQAQTPKPGSLVAQWYRITGSDDIQGSGGNYTRRVFLVGPDWKGASDSNKDHQPTVYAILCDGVVNVFQATMPK